MHLMNTYPPGEPYSEEDAGRIGIHLGRWWAEEDATPDQLSLLHQDSLQPVNIFDAPSARSLARLLLPEDEWGDWGESCFWDAVAGDYVYLTKQPTFVEGFADGALDYWCNPRPG